MEEIINDYEYSSLLADIKRTNYGYKEVIELWNAIDEESSTYEEYSDYDIARTIVFLINKLKKVETDFIPKSKIKEKIEELSSYYKKEIYPSRYQWEDLNITEYYDGQIELLQELLEEE